MTSLSGVSPGRVGLASARRRVLLSAALAAVWAVPLASPLLASAASAAGDANATPNPAPSPDFLEISRFLTGHATLDASLAARLYGAFLALDAGFAARAAALAAYIKTSGVTPTALQKALDADKSAVADLPRQLMQGWMLGIVGSGEKARCVAYEDSLANVAALPYVRPPSFAYGTYGSWAVRPAAIAATRPI